MTESRKIGESTLVIGYGNTLRGDDGVGTKVAGALAEMNLPGVRCTACHQLTPELAVQISEAQTVIFVDAAVNPRSDIQFLELRPAETGQIMAHAADPGTLLSLARDVFGHCPRAWCLTIPIQNTGFGEKFSPLASRGVQAAIEKIRSFTRGNPPE
jgi:hydrogenase maturation protease